MEKEKIGSRIREIMKLRKLRQVDVLRLAEPLCKQYNISLQKSDLSQYYNGKHEPSQDKLFILGQVLEVNEAWLLGYDVPMERDFCVIDGDNVQLENTIVQSDNNTIGGMIVQYRNDHNMSMRAFSRASGLSPPYISSLEKGMTQRGNAPSPSLETYKTIAKTMKISLEALLNAIDEDAERTVFTDNNELSGAHIEAIERIKSWPEEKVKSFLKFME